jgi:hypothetical protein
MFEERWASTLSTDRRQSSCQRHYIVGQDRHNITAAGPGRDGIGNGCALRSRHTDEVASVEVTDAGCRTLRFSGRRRSSVCNRLLDRWRETLCRCYSEDAKTTSEREHMSREGAESDVRLGTHSSREVGAGTPLPWNERALDGTARPTRSVCGVAVPCGTVEDE